ncbi:hypothetical protein PMZ80_004216 [Knufia obscura]|uniref:alpha-1,2-Mannosidase n=1 Tax=Knufia obscura TaxID=1635080 RepID=A0ABR0RRH4_9EURO|nr:hypothetical protein PMZ80_004216 [Knufia obscura]
MKPFTYLALLLSRSAAAQASPQLYSQWSNSSNIPSTSSLSTTTESPYTSVATTTFSQVTSDSAHSSSSGSTTTSIAPACATIQSSSLSHSRSDAAKAEAVKNAFIRSWNQYSDYCFGQDTLIVTNDTCINNYNGWGVTIVDALDTAIIMNLTGIVSASLAHIAAVDFTTVKTFKNVNGFETTIRYLGGLLSAYDLINSDLVEDGTYDADHVDALLTQAVTLAGKLNFRFDSPSGLPTDSVDFFTNTGVSNIFVSPLDNTTYDSSNTAVCGSFTLEYYRLSDLTGDDTYRRIADNAVEKLTNLSSAAETSLYPGLVGSQVDLDSGRYLQSDYGWGANIDSFYEYLIKSYIYGERSDVDGATYWAQAVLSTVDNTLVSPYDWPDLTFVQRGDAFGSPKYTMDTYTCFAGGNWLYGATYLLNYNPNHPDLQSFITSSLSLISTCNHLYNTTTSGLAPAKISWFNSTFQTTNATWESNGTYQASAQSRGYFILDAQYDSFPETIESIWYAWRITGDTKYKDWNWEIFRSLMEQSDRDGGVAYGGIMDVDEPTPRFKDALPSYYFAETLKYLYLTFLVGGVVSLDGWVFNTEGHPFRIGGCEG